MYFVGADIGGTFIKLGIISDEGVIITQKTVPANFKCEYAITISNICLEIKDLLESMGLDTRDIGGIGIGVPGTVHNGIVTFANNLNWHNVPLADEVRRHIDTEVVVGNDANCACLGEYGFGSAKDCSDVIMVTLGTGLGTGIICDNHLIKGYKSAGAEGGHMVIRAGGIKCNCGRQGCYEEYASTTAMINMTKEAIQEYPDSLLAKTPINQVNGFTLFDAVRENDEVAKKVLEIYIKNIAEGLVNFANIFRPQIILIGGGISNEKDLLIKPLEALVNEKAYGGKNNPYIKVKKAMLGNKAGIVGAACQVMKK